MRDLVKRNKKNSCFKDQGRIHCITFNYSDEIRICLISFGGNKLPGSIFGHVSSN